MTEDTGARPGNKEKENTLATDNSSSRIVPYELGRTPMLLTIFG
jgi:hypothetical protein